jgi:hypothetical protein
MPNWQISTWLKIARNADDLAVASWALMASMIVVFACAVFMGLV